MPTQTDKVEIKFVPKEQKLDKEILNKVNASIKGGKLVFTKDQTKERKEFQKLLDQHGYKLKSFEIGKPLKYPDVLLNKEIQLTQEKVVEEMKRIAVLDESLRLREMIELSLKVSHEFYLLLYNPDRKEPYEELQSCKDKKRRAELKKQLSKLPMHLRYLIRDGFYIEMSFRESKSKASKRLYKAICEGSAKYEKSLNPLDYAANHQIIEEEKPITFSRIKEND